MKILVFTSVLALTATAAVAADAPKASCLDPHKSYVARPLNDHDVFAQQSIGKPKPPVRIKTSCIHIGSAIGIGLSGTFNCIGLGDRVVATVGGSRESCVVTRVLPYAPEEGDNKQP